MTAKFTGRRLAALLVAQALWLAASHAEESAPKKFGDEVEKQESIYQSAGENVPSGYTIGRSLAEYAGALPADFDRELAKLGPDQRWLDIGAGMGQAIIDYYTPEYDKAHPEGADQRGKKARTVAISIEDRRTSAWRQKADSVGRDRMQYLPNKRLREYSDADLGRFDVITDVIGGFSYTTDLTLFMEKVLGFLKVNGSFYTVLQDVHSEEGSNPPYYKGSPYLTEIVGADGGEIKVCSWLKRISCVQVSCELRTGWTPPIEVFQVRKVCHDTSVPPLTAVHYAAGTPPERRFKAQALSATNISPSR